MKALSLILILAVVGCAGTPQTRAKVSLAAACNAHSALLVQLTPRKAELSPTTIKRVDDSITLLEPVCRAGSTFDPALGVTVVERAMAMIRGDL